jgi:integrase
MKRSAYLVRSRHGVFHARIVVPVALRSIVGKQEIRRTLETNDERLARVRALQLAYEFAKLFNQMKPKHPQREWQPVARLVTITPQGVAFDKPEDAEAAMKVARELGFVGPNTAPAIPATKPLAELRDLYVADRQNNWAPRTKMMNLRTINRYAEWCHKSNLSPFEKSTAAEFKAKVLRPILKSDQSLNKDIGRLQTFFTWAHDHGQASVNPFTRMKVRGKSGAPRSNRKAYSEAEVQLLLDNANPGADPRHWLFLIAIYSGARLREIAQLRVEDVQHIDGIDVLLITEDEEDEQMSVKSGKPRQVPIHAELKRMGLLTYVEQLRQSKERRLFPMLQGHHLDGYGDAAGRWFRRTFRVSINLKRGFHELRNTFITQMFNLGTPEPVVNSITGHELGRSTSLSTYTGALSLDVIDAALQRLPVNPGVKR